MRIGIATRYFPHESTYVAIRLAELLQQLGHDVSLESATASPVKLDCPWDSRLISSRDFASWMATVDSVIWTHVPYSQELNAVKAAGRSTFVIPSWVELRPVHRKILQRADGVLCPHAAAAHVLSRWPSVRSFLVEWDCGTPITQRAGLLSQESISAVVPLYDDEGSLYAGLLDQLVRILNVMPQVKFTLAYNRSRIQSSVLRRLRGIHKRFGDRCAAACGVPYRNQAMLYGRHDLTVWPARGTNIGLTGLNSLAMGTPVLCWQSPPLAEIVSPSAGQRVSCGLRMNELGVTEAEPDFCRFGIELQLLLSNPDRILLMQQSTAAALFERRNNFVDFWRRMFDDM